MRFKPWSLRAALGLAAGLACATGAQAQQTIKPDTQAMMWAAACANCHGTAGNAVPDGGMPALVGRDADWIAQQMKDFADGKRPATIMHQLSKGYTDDQVKRIALWLSQQTPEVAK